MNVIPFPRAKRRRAPLLICNRSPQWWAANLTVLAVLAGAIRVLVIWVY